MEEKSRRGTAGGEEGEREAKQERDEETNRGDEVWGEAVEQFNY